MKQKVEKTETWKVIINQWLPLGLQNSIWSFETKFILSERISGKATNIRHFNTHWMFAVENTQNFNDQQIKFKQNSFQTILTPFNTRKKWEPRCCRTKWIYKTLYEKASCTVRRVYCAWRKKNKVERFVTMCYFASFPHLTRMCQPKTKNNSCSHEKL